MSEKKNLSEDVYQFVLEKIMRQEIPCGGRVPVDSLAKEMGVSRTPFIEALTRLGRSGLVNIYPRRYVEVTTFDEKSISDLGYTRIAVDTLAIQLAIRYGSLADYDRLRDLADICTAEAEKGDVYSWIKSECDFHLELIRVGGNENLIQIMEDLFLKIRLVQTVIHEKERLDAKKVKLHYDILDCIENRDVDGALYALQQHLGHFYNMDPSSIKTVVISHFKKPQGGLSTS